MVSYNLQEKALLDRPPPSLNSSRSLLLQFAPSTHLDLCLDILNGVAGLHLQGDGLACGNGRNGQRKSGERW